MYNLTTYPNLVGLLEQLGVESHPSDMSFALSMDGGALEWGSHGLHSIFAQRRNILSPSFLRMVWDVIRFGQLAPLVRICLAPLCFSTHLCSLHLLIGAAAHSQRLRLQTWLISLHAAHVSLAEPIHNPCRC